MTSFNIPGAVDAPRRNYYGTPPALPIVATYIFCDGSESQLSDCPGFLTYQYYAKYCPSTRIAGAKCLSE